MRKSKIFFVSTEIYPFVRSGRSGEFAGSLPTYLQTAGHEVRVIMPKYSLINERKHVIRDIIRLKDIPVTMPFESGMISVKSGFLPESKTQIYFVDYEKYFKRTDLFRDKRTGQYYRDNDERFIFFARAAIETLKTLGWHPDIIHCCDWPTGILPAMIRHEQKVNGLFKKSIVVFSLNHLDETGSFDKATWEKTGVSEDAVPRDRCFHKNKLSFLKTAVSLSDAVTVPHAYRHLKSIGRPKNDFEAILAPVKSIVDLSLGGDNNLWNPANNNSLQKSYTVEKYDRRKVNREKFLEAKRTNFSIDQPILGILAESFAEQRKAVAAFLKTLRDVPLQIFLIADENPLSDSTIKGLVSRQEPHILYALHDPDDQQRHNFFAVCDLFWIPPSEDFSEIMYFNGMHFGAIPVIRKESPVAGYYEPIRDKAHGNALVYSDEKDLITKLRMVLTTYQDEASRWDDAARRTMRSDLSWNHFLSPVLKVYERAFSKLK